MNLIHGFELLRKDKVPEVDAVASLYRHLNTGAQVLSMECEEENKVFGITFRTPPPDSSGIPHILEHSVLCGSRKYPVKEPFVELLKGSLNTYLNALTYPDKTCYPVASQNLKDFYNLMDVYLDAVFFPRLTPYVFQQEGWHYELKSPDDPLTIKGVVYNEMKGAYSSPDSLLSEVSIQSLFPDTPYGYDSGGDPKKIPELTYERFLDFHRKYYHPSNARVFFYGDDPPEERLRRLNDIFMEFDQIDPHSDIGLQPPFDRPLTVHRTFASGKGPSQNHKGMVTVNWVTVETSDIKANLAFQVLGYILLGMPASPLKKALIDSGLGEGIAGLGFENELRQTIFSAGLKGVDTKNLEKVEPLILDTLDKLVDRGIEQGIVEAALNTVEFWLRENNTGQLPRGLSLMMRSLTTWLYGYDPILSVAFEDTLASVKRDSKPGFFEGMIDEFLLSNPHRSTVLLIPDPEQLDREEAEEQTRLASIKASMTAKEIEEIVKNTLELERLQRTPDPPEALSTIPMLTLSDLEKRERPIPMEVIDCNGSTLLFHDIFSNGIVYVDSGFDLHSLPREYLSYVPLFGKAMVHMGTEKEDFVSLSKRISRKTGGITPQVFVSSVHDSPESKTLLLLRGKAIGKEVEELINIFRDISLLTRFDDPERFRQILLEEKARVERQLIPVGHQIVSRRLRSHFNESGFVAEQMRGLSYLFFLRDLVSRLERDWNSVLGILEDIRRRVITESNAIFNVTCDEKDFYRCHALIDSMASGLPKGEIHRERWPDKFPLSSPIEGLSIPSQVNFVGKGMDLTTTGYEFHGSSLVITKYIRNTWLWNRVRVEGGAYGAFCSLDRISGALTLVSYRDPNVKKTLETFDRISLFLRDIALDEKELTKAIIGTMGDLDPYRLPDAKGYVSMVRFLIGDTEEIREKMRGEILDTDLSSFRRHADMFDHLKRSGIIKIMGPEDAIREAAGDAETQIVKVM